MSFTWRMSRGDNLLRLSLPAPSRAEAIAACGERAQWGASIPLLRSLGRDLRRYFAGDHVELGCYPVDLSDQPPFHRRALLAARRIPHGEVRSYAWVADSAGSPRAARAVGRAMARNPVPLVIPCHRVVGADGGLTGFGSGLPATRALLELEGIACRTDRLAGRPPGLR